MKTLIVKLLLILLAASFNVRCAQSPFFLTNYHLAKSYVVTDNANGCSYLYKVRTKAAPNSKKYAEAYLSAISVLKIFADNNPNRGNVLYNIRMTERDFPIAEAEVYRCPQEIFDKYKSLQNDKEYIEKNIKFDLVISDDRKK